MRKNINIAIASIAFIAAAGTCGALECGTIAFAPAAIASSVFAIIALLASRSASRDELLEEEEARRSAARAARREAMVASRPATRRIKSVELVRF